MSALSIPGDPGDRVKEACGAVGFCSPSLAQGLLWIFMLQRGEGRKNSVECVTGRTFSLPSRSVVGANQSSLRLRAWNIHAQSGVGLTQAYG